MYKLVEVLLLNNGTDRLGIQSKPSWNFLLEQFVYHQLYSLDKESIQ